MDKRPVVIFDSGLGGLTAVKALHELLPEEDIIYFADSARVPYGCRTPDELRIMTGQNLDFLSSFGVKAVMAACGTVSSNTPEVLENYFIPAFGVIKASIKAMSAIPGSAPLGITATAASIKSGAVQRGIMKSCPGRKLVCAPCPDFVTLIESGHSAPDDRLLKEAVRKYLSPLKESGVAAVLLGCTHFGIISEAITDFMGRDVRLVSAAELAAEDFAGFLENNSLTGGSGSLRCYTSGSPEEFSALASTFLGRELEIPPEHVEAMEV